MEVAIEITFINIITFPLYYSSIICKYFVGGGA